MVFCICDAADFLCYGNLGHGLRRGFHPGGEKLDALIRKYDGMAFIQEPDPSRHGIIQILGEENPHHPPGVIFSQSEVVENNLALEDSLVQIHIGSD